MNQSMPNAQLVSRSDGQLNDIKNKNPLNDAPEPRMTSEVYKAILARELLINEIQDSQAKYF